MENTYRDSLSRKDEKLHEMILKINKIDQEKITKKETKSENFLDYKFLYDNLKLEVIL